MRKVRYYVYYGNNTSREACYTMADVHAAVSHFLRSGTPITAITKA